MYTYLAHYNHNHDKLGRFARSSGKSDFTLPKNYKVYRVGSRREKEKTDLRTYVSTTDIDNKIYTTVSKYVFRATHKYVLKTTKDSRIAGDKTQKEVFRSLVKDFKPDDFAKHISYVDSQINKNLKNIKTSNDVVSLYKNVDRSRKDFETAYDAFICNINNTQSKLSEEFFNRLSAKGYDGALDRYDSHDPKHPGLQFLSNGNINVKAQQAVIFFDRGDNLKRISKRRITDKQRSEAIRWLQESGLMELKIIEDTTEGGFDLNDAVENIMEVKNG